MGDDRFTIAREAMVRTQIAARGIDDPRLLDAMRQVPRHLFVPSHLAGHAYEDRALPIEAGQTISQPFIVAQMIAAARVGSSDKVLDVGGGSGYAAAVLSRLAARVTSVERLAALAGPARDRLRALGYAGVTVVQADGSKGWAPEAPYDVILVAAAASHVPRALTGQLVDGGRLVMPLGTAPLGERLVLMTRQGNRLVQHDLGAVRFVPLIED